MSSPGGHGAPNDEELDADEPRTPLWLPLLGLTLFVAALVYVLVNQKPAPESAAPAASASAEPAASANAER